MKARTRIALTAFVGTFALTGCGSFQSSVSALSSALSSEGSLLVSSNSSSEPFIDPTVSASSSAESSQASAESSQQVSSESQQTSQETSSAVSSESSIEVDPVYDEEPDSLDCLDADDMSGLYGAFARPITNYTSSVTSYFNNQGLYDYYRHYAKNYVQEKTSVFTDKSMYTYPRDERYLSVLNLGYVDLSDGIHSFELPGDNVNARLSYTLTNSDLALVKENDSYRNHVFTLEDLNQSYFTTYGFKRVSAKKYQYDRQFNATKDNLVFGNFIDITAPYLENEGFYMTFSKVTIEVAPMKDVAFRIRLYAYKTQKSKLVTYHQKEDYQNWYLLFSETLITDVGATEFHPVSALIDEHSGHNPH